MSQGIVCINHCHANMHTRVETVSTLEKSGNAMLFHFGISHFGTESVPTKIEPQPLWLCQSGCVVRVPKWHSRFSLVETHYMPKWQRQNGICCLFTSVEMSLYSSSSGVIHTQTTCTSSFSVISTTLTLTY